MLPLYTDIAHLGPEIFLSMSALILLIFGAWRGDRALPVIAGLGILALLLAAGEMATNTSLWERATAFSDMWVTDALAVTLKIICLLGLSAAIGISLSALRHDLMARFEYPILIMLSGIGMMIMLSANDFLVLYMGLELSSLALYVLAAFRRDTLNAAEAGMKYFILGALSSGMLLFGMSLVYGFAGTTNYDVLTSVLVDEGIGDPVTTGVIIGMAFILAGVAFKISAVPFHMWVPDVYQGAPGAVTALFAMVPKIAAMGMLIRLLFVPFAPMMSDWVQIIAFLALGSMMWGAFAAIAQNNIKRLLAYSSIGNLGYALVALVVGTTEGIAATLFYLVIYLAMTAGTFAIILTIRRDGEMIEDMEDYSGLSRTHPVLAYGLAVFMFAMSGLPPLAGFFGKLMVFQVVMGAGFYTLAIVGVVTSVVAAYYYLRVIRIMFFDKPRETLQAVPDPGQKAVIAIALIIVLGLIMCPDPLYQPALTAAGAMTLAHH